METFLVRLKIRAECVADAHELIQDYTGQETDVEILEIMPADERRASGATGDTQDAPAPRPSLEVRQMEEECESGNGAQPATDKQRNYIRYLAQSVELTKSEASDVINKLLKQGGDDEPTEMQEVQE